jgi:hypothetical protein
LEFGDLVDTFPHRHPDFPYSTFKRSTTSGETLVHGLPLTTSWSPSPMHNIYMRCQYPTPAQ